MCHEVLNIVCFVTFSVKHEKNFYRKYILLVALWKMHLLQFQQSFGGTHAKDYSSYDFKDTVNLKSSLHLVHIYVCPIISF